MYPDYKAAKRDEFSLSEFEAKIYFPGHDFGDHSTIQSMRYSMVKFQTTADVFAKFGGTYKAIMLVLTFMVFPFITNQYRRDVAHQIMKKSQDDFVCIKDVFKEMHYRFQAVNIFYSIGQIQQL